MYPVNVALPESRPSSPTPERIVPATEQRLREPACFTSLPMELKAKVVAMVSLQEEAWSWRVKDDEEKRARHVNCLSSLALVSSELRALAAPHQFNHLRSDRSLTPLFQLVVLPVHGASITKVWLVKGNTSAAITLFGSSLQLSGHSSHPMDLTPFRVNRIKQIGSKIKFLALDDFTPGGAATFINLFPTLRELCVTGLKDSEAPGEFRALNSEIATQKTLLKLTVGLATGTTQTWPVDALDPFAGAPAPPLKCLQMYHFWLDEYLLKLVDIFAGTVESLSFEVSMQPHYNPSSLTPVALGRLVALQAGMKDSSALSHILGVFTTSSSLTSATIFYNVGERMDPTGPAVLAFLAAQPSLRRLKLGSMSSDEHYTWYAPTERISKPSTLAAYASLVRERQLEPFVLDAPHLLPFDPNADLSCTENEAGFLKEVLGRTLEFGRMELERIFAEGNIAGAVDWVEVLRPLEEKRLAWKD